MDVMRFTLWRFIEEHATDKSLAIRAFEIAEPLFLNAACGHFVLDPGPSLDRRSVAGAIARAADTVVNGIDFVSSTGNADGIVGALDSAEHFVTHLPFSLWQNRLPAMESLLGESLKEGLLIAMAQSVIDPLLDSIWRSHADFLGRLDPKMLAAVWNTPLIAMYYLFAYAMKGERSAFDDMTPLVEMLPRAIPIGEPWSDLETWLVLAA